MSRLDHPSYQYVRRDDAARPLPLGQRVDDGPAARHDARQMHTAGGHHLEHDPRLHVGDRVRLLPRRLAMTGTIVGIDSSEAFPVAVDIGDPNGHAYRFRYDEVEHVAEHDPRLALKVTVAFGVLCAAVMLLVSCHTEADESWFCAEASCEVTP